MASNSISNTKKSLILHMLTNTSLRDALHSGSSSSHFLSPSMQQLSAVKKLTTLYLGNSASISESIQKLNTPKAQASPDAEISSSSCYQLSGVITNLTIVTLLMLVLFTHP